MPMLRMQIVTVFPSFTAVFLPPTAHLYGTNVINILGLAWEHGLLVIMLLTLVAAMIPLW
jgi:Mg2+ and Co2+ transporter CorA